MNEKISKIITWMKNHKIITGILFFILLIIVIPSSPKKDTPTQVIEQKVIFDIPALMDKKIDEITKALGDPKSTTPPEKGQLLEDRLWDITYEKEGYTLFVTYNYDTKIARDFFFSKSGIITDKQKDTYLKMTNTKNNDTAYNLEFVKTIKNPDEYTGLLITSRKQLQEELDKFMTTAKKANLVNSYDFSKMSDTTYKWDVYIDKFWYTLTVPQKKDFIAYIAKHKKEITGYSNFQLKDAYTNEVVGELKGFSQSIEVYK